MMAQEHTWKKEDRARKHTIWGMKAQRCTRNEVGLENALPGRWEPKGVLERGFVVRHLSKIKV
jgi:hypothetical protein